MSEYVFVDFFVYNKYMNINLADIDIPVAEYGSIISSITYNK